MIVNLITHVLSNNLKLSTATDHRSTTTLNKCDLYASMLHLLKIPYIFPWMPRTIQKPGWIIFTPTAVSTVPIHSESYNCFPVGITAIQE